MQKGHEKRERIAIVWQCLTGDLRQKFKTEGCGQWNLTMMRTPEGQAWCKECNRRTRMNAGRCYQYRTKEEAQKAIIRVHQKAGDF